MAHRTVKTTLNEDLEKLGLPGLSMTEQAILGGIPLTESDNDDAGGDLGKYQDLLGEDFERLLYEAKKAKKKKKMSKFVKELAKRKDIKDPEALAGWLAHYNPPNWEEIEAEYDEDDIVDEGIHPFDAPVVNDELFDAIMGLPFDSLAAEDVEEVLGALKDKELPEDADEDLVERAEEVVEFLIEAVAKKTRRAKSGSMAKKASFQCPPGTRKDPKDPAGRRCVRAAKAAGGAGKLAKERRKKGRWAKSGKGKMSARKSSRWAARRENDVQSQFAEELYGLLEDKQDVKASVRDELIERIGDILEMFAEEFNDEAVTRVFEEAYEPVMASVESGRMDEDVMDDDEFIAEIKPLVSLIHKSIDRLGVDSGN